MQVQVVVSWNNDIIGRAARLIGMKWSHAAIRSKSEMSDDWWVHEAIASGIVFRPWDEFLKGKEEVQIMETRKPLSSLDAHEIVAFASGNVGRPYDFKLLLKIAWRCLKKYLFGIVMLSSHVCSTLVHSSFKYVGIDLCPDVGGVVTPDDIAESELLKVVS